MTDINKTFAEKAKQHTVYKLSDGTRVPGVTTILGVLAKPALIAWANRMGLAGIDTSKYVDQAAQAGTAAHEMIHCHLTGKTFDPSQYAPALVKIAENGFIKYLDWEGRQKLEDVRSEIPLVSEMYRFGGTIDVYCILNGQRTLIDFKTNSTGIYDEMRYQVAGGYRLLLKQNELDVERVIIVRLGKSENMDLEVAEVGDWERCEKIFLRCRELYDLLKK